VRTLLSSLLSYFLYHQTVQCPVFVCLALHEQIDISRQTKTTNEICFKYNPRYTQIGSSIRYVNMFMVFLRVYCIFINTNIWNIFICIFLLHVYLYQSESKLINGVAGKTTGHVILIWKCWHFRRGVIFLGWQFFGTKSWHNFLLINKNVYQRNISLNKYIT
jgi:hypothetical protein